VRVVMARLRRLRRRAIRCPRNFPRPIDDVSSLRLEICGGIASGKTTLMRLLAGRGVATPVAEEFETNPFWRAFYMDPRAVCFETEITFLLQHYHQLKNVPCAGAPLAADFSLLLDHAYALVSLRGGRLRAFMAVYEQVCEEVGHARLLVNLECGVEDQLQRIGRRGREAERSVDVGFLRELNAALGEVVKPHGGGGCIVNIDSGRVNFASDDRGRAEAVAAVERAFADAFGKGVSLGRTAVSGTEC